MKYSEQDMAALISEVETQFSEHLAKAEKEDQASLQKSEEANAETEAVSEAKVEENTEVQKSETEVEESNVSESLEYDDEDIAEMNKLYTGMTKSEAELHYKAVKKAVFGEEEESTEVKKSETKVEEVKEEKIEKSEVVEVKTETKEDDSIAKSEYQAVQKENEELKKSLEGLTSALGKFLKGSKAPKQKAITKIEYVKKNEIENTESQETVDVSALSRNDVSKILTNKLRSGEIKKNEDRKAINAFYEDNMSIETIKHLL